MTPPDPTKQKWLISYLLREGFFGNRILEEDPIMWLVSRRLAGYKDIILISCFYLEVDEDLFQKIKLTINGVDHDTPTKSF